MAIFKHDCWNEMVILNNKSPFVELMKTVEVLFFVRVFISTFAIKRLIFFILKFLLLKLANYEITLMINIINNIHIFIHLQSMVQYCLYFLNSKALVLFQHPFKNYRLINRYRPVWSNLAIGKMHEKSVDLYITLCFYFRKKHMALQKQKKPLKWSYQILAFNKKYLFLALA